jgi:hypothetical protein
MFLLLYACIYITHVLYNVSMYHFYYNFTTVFLIHESHIVNTDSMRAEHAFWLPARSTISGLEQT